MIEIKNVSIADYVDISNKERKKLGLSFNDKLFEDKIAIFPDSDSKHKTNINVVNKYFKALFFILWSAIIEEPTINVVK